MPAENNPEAGYTMIEVGIVMLLLGVILALATGAVTTFQTTLGRADARSQTNDQGRLAVQEIDRFVRSGNILYNPALENDAVNHIYPGLSLRIYTQANGIQRCIQWRVSGGLLQSRSWSQSWEGDDIVSGWHVVATNIMNTTSTPAFALDSTNGFGGRLLNVSLLVNTAPAQGSTANFKVSVAGRNTEYGYNPSVCSSIPPYDY